MNNSTCPCIFIKRSKIGFVINIVYVDNLNLVETLKVFTKTTDYLKSIWNERFEENKILFWLVDQTIFKWNVSPWLNIYTEKLSKHFYMDKSHPLNSPIVVRLLKVKNGHFSF